MRNESVAPFYHITHIFTHTHTHTHTHTQSHLPVELAFSGIHPAIAATVHHVELILQVLCFFSTLEAKQLGRPGLSLVPRPREFVPRAVYAKAGLSNRFCLSVHPKNSNVAWPYFQLIFRPGLIPRPYL